MKKLKTLAIIAVSLTFTGGALAVELPHSKAQTALPAPFASLLNGEFRLSQTATCIHNSKRYNKGARLCMSGVWNYCNKLGLWEPSKQSC